MYDYAQLTRRWFEEVWNQQQCEVIAELMAPNAAFYGLGDSPNSVCGIEEFQAFHAKFCGALPDVHVQVDDVIVQGDRSAARLTVTATHQGDELGIKATGRAVHFTGIVFVRWEGCLVVEGWNEFNFASMHEQIGPRG